MHIFQYAVFWDSHPDINHTTGNNMRDLHEILRQRMLCFDGAVGTVLAERTGERTLVESLLLTDAGGEIVRALHREYAELGADVVTTNSFAANRIALERTGVAVDVAFLNERAVRAAREAVTTHCLVAGSVGPLNLGLHRADYSTGALEEIYTEQIEALARAGVDLLKLETFDDPDEAGAALRVARNTALPVILYLHGWRRGQNRRTACWAPVLRFAEEAGVLAVGCNCAPPQDIADSLLALRGMTALPLAAQPNSGTPHIERGVAFWPEPAEGLGEWYRRYIALGARIIGGCCGITPDHMPSIYHAVRENIPVPEPDVVTLSATLPVEKTLIRRPENPLRAFLDTDRTYVSVEIRAGAGRSLDRIFDECAALPLDRVDFFDVPDNPGAGVARDSMMVALALQERFGILSIPHRATTHTNAIQMQSGLLAAWDLGIKGVLAVTGDIPQVGDHQGVASRVVDLKSSVALLRLIESLNNGFLMTGKSIAAPCDFITGCAFNPNSPRTAQVNWLRKKVEAGARFVFTQPVFDREGLARVGETAQEFPGIRFFIGILPLSGLRQARSLAEGRIPGIHVPDKVVRALEAFPDAADQKRMAEELATGMARAAAESFRGVYLIPPFSQDGMEITGRLAEAVR